MEQLFTVWGETLDKEHVLDEYPRPLMVRDSYLNLNGYWDYAFTQEFVCPKEFDGKILVPFSPKAFAPAAHGLLSRAKSFCWARKARTDSFPLPGVLIPSPGQR